MADDMTEHSSLGVSPDASETHMTTCSRFLRAG